MVIFNALLLVSLIWIFSLAKLANGTHIDALNNDQNMTLPVILKLMRIVF
jgi:hypothetical protein